VAFAPQGGTTRPAQASKSGSESTRCWKRRHDERKSFALVDSDLINMIDARRVKRTRAPNDSVNFVSLRQKQFGKIRPVLPGNAGDERRASCVWSPIFFNRAARKVQVFCEFSGGLDTRSPNPFVYRCALTAQSDPPDFFVFRKLVRNVQESVRVRHASVNGQNCGAPLLPNTRPAGLRRCVDIRGSDESRARRA